MEEEWFDLETQGENKLRLLCKKQTIANAMLVLLLFLSTVVVVVVVFIVVVVVVVFVVVVVVVVLILLQFFSRTNCLLKHWFASICSR